MKQAVSFFSCLVRTWTWRMAWRDSRRSRRRLLLYGASIILGIAALTAISSLGRQMELAIQEQSKALLGADLVVSSRDALTSEQGALLESFGGEQSREVAFPSMVFFVKNGGTRLVQIRALTGRFPFYGALETVPQDGAARFREGAGALVEKSLADIFDAQVGDSIKVGEATLPIIGLLTRVPGETMAFGTIAPRVYIPLGALEKTHLLQEGSLARYKVHFKFRPEVNAEALAERHRSELRRLQLRVDTVEERQQDIGRGLDNMLRFLNLVGFVALLLGGVGVASGIHVHMTQKLSTIATLRCLGGTSAQAFAIYFAQALALGLAGAILGAAIGVAVQFFIPTLLAEFLPFPLHASVSWSAAWNGIWLGFLICTLFSILPLLPIRRVSPLTAVRSAFTHEIRGVRDPLTWLAYLAVAGGLVAFGVSQARDWRHGLGYAVGIVVAFGLLTVMAWIVARVARMLVSPVWPFVWRQGLSNLYRPNNRTVLLMVSLGMGTFLVLTLYLVQVNLLNELARPQNRNEGNAVLFDIQPDQRQGVLEVLRSQQLPVIEDVPMVSMRLKFIKGSTIEEIRKDPRDGRRGWALTREYRSTYRPDLAPTEKMIAGTWHRSTSGEGPVPVSLEEGIARNLRVGIGDEMVFDIQGVSVTATVANLRQVDWRRLSPNFFMVFPPGAIDDAPGMHMVVTRIQNSEQSARLQREVVTRFPNVSAVDLMLVLQTVEGVLDKITFVIRFMALFTVGTALLVLAGTIVSGRYQRLRESILLRTLGATRGQVLCILTAEYLCLGVLAAMTGILLANAAGWVLAEQVFKMKFGFHVMPMAVAVGLVSLVTVMFGLLGNRGMLSRPPLEVLRSQV